MSVQPENKESNYYTTSRNSETLNRRVDVNDLVSKMNENKAKEKKNSMILGAAAISAVTVFGIILTL